MEYIRVEIASLSLVPSGGGTCAIILREVDGVRILPVVIGLLEAQAIAVKIQKMPIPRPLTHDLMICLMENTSSKLKRITIDNVREGTFYATLEIERDGQLVRLDSRPSDAIALAVRCSAPILVAESVMSKAGASPDGMPEPDRAFASSDADSGVSQDEDADADSGDDEDDEEGEDESEDPIGELEEEMKSAIEEEDYERAAQIRDEIRRIKHEA
ncbi:MAG: bifunctional nuclease family protein [Opitutales bacterium]|nr:bifunctional nuclease family protein [Opitutales bacterium]